MYTSAYFPISNWDCALSVFKLVRSYSNSAGATQVCKLVGFRGPLPPCTASSRPSYSAGQVCVTKDRLLQHSDELVYQYSTNIH